MTETRTFDLGDVLTVTTGRLVSRRGVEAIYDVLNHMTGDNLMTHQLPRACGECAPEILRQHPDLADVDLPEHFYGKADVFAWLDRQVARFGPTRDVTPLPAEDHARIDPLAELAMMRPDMPVIAIVTDDTAAGA